MTLSKASPLTQSLPTRPPNHTLISTSFFIAREGRFGSQNRASPWARPEASREAGDAAPHHYHRARRAAGFGALGETRDGVNEGAVAQTGPPRPATPVPEPDARPAASTPARAPPAADSGQLRGPDGARAAGPGGARGDPGGGRRTSRGGKRREAARLHPRYRSGSSSVAQWLKEAKKLEQPVSREQPGEEKS